MATKRRRNDTIKRESRSKKRKLNDKKLESDEEEEEKEDEDGYLLTSELDKNIQSGLYALHNKDPLIYDRKHSFVKNENDQSDKDAKYPWVKQIDDEEQDTFLQNFFRNQLWKCKDENALSSIGVHRGYEGIEHNLDDIGLSEDDQTIDKQNDFERQWQKKNSLEFEKEINAQIQKQQDGNKLNKERKLILAFLEED